MQVVGRSRMRVSNRSAPRRWHSLEMKPYGSARSDSVLSQRARGRFARAASSRSAVAEGEAVEWESGENSTGWTRMKTLINDELERQVGKARSHRLSGSSSDCEVSS